MVDAEGAEPISADELRAAVFSLRWHHTMDLGHGIITPGGDVHELGPERVGMFDVVLFLGVLYHVRHPLLALERVYSVTSDLLILEIEVARLGTRRPMMVFLPGAELGGDPTNWWAPNEAGVVASRRPAMSAARSVRRLARAARGGDSSPVTTAQADRIVVHAHR